MSVKACPYCGSSKLSIANDKTFNIHGLYSYDCDGCKRRVAIAEIAKGKLG